MRSKIYDYHILDARKIGEKRAEKMAQAKDQVWRGANVRVRVVNRSKVKSPAHH